MGEGEPTYIIAEIGSNFDGDIERAKMLIDLAKDSGADAVKFQSFTADKIVSKKGFEDLKLGFQKNWKKSVYDVYNDAELPLDWLKELFHYSNRKGIHFLSTPYEKAAADVLDDLGVLAYKIGSGDINWPEMLSFISKKGKPIILGSGASNLSEIDEAIRIIRSENNNEIILLQCVTNYPSAFKYSNLKAMVAMGKAFDVLVGYSDHTPGSVVPIGAVSLGACVIEKHFTDDKSREGPDHPFSMDNTEFKKMVNDIRVLEEALGSTFKDIYEEEKETVFLQRRCLRANKTSSEGSKITEDMVAVLRPQSRNALEPKYKDLIMGRTLKKDIKKGDPFKWEDV